MRRPSVAQDTASERRRRFEGLSTDERMALALELGRRHLTAYAEANGLTVTDARALLERRRQARRRPSASIEALLR